MSVWVGGKGLGWAEPGGARVLSQAPRLIVQKAVKA